MRRLTLLCDGRICLEIQVVSYSCVKTLDTAVVIGHIEVRVLALELL